MSDFPKTQRAVQLIGPDELKYNPEKEVYLPNDYQLLCKVEAVGLCFSDLKLLKQFDAHVRKSEIIGGIDKSVLEEYPAYKVDKEPTVPGHEAVLRVLAVGDKVTKSKVGDRFLVQADHRWLMTEQSNGAFGYNLEGALQEYSLIDERVSTSPDGEYMMIPAPEDRSASAIALCEPWACVEDSYVVKERTTIKEGGRMLIVVESDKFDTATLVAMLGRFGKPASIDFISSGEISIDVDVKTNTLVSLDGIDSSYNDVIYYGSNATTAEKLFDRVAAHGILNIVLCGGKFDRDVESAVGRVHYGGIRIVGTLGDNPAESMEYIPATGEIREGNKINVIGAGGPMGVMHVIRNICQGVKDVTVMAGDLDDERLAPLTAIAEPLAQQRGVKYVPYNPTKGDAPTDVDYMSLMAPVPALVAQGIKDAAQGGIINIFAGIAASVLGKIDLNSYIEKKLYFIGTSGSTLEDMLTVLNKVKSGDLDTNLSVAAIGSLESAVEGIRAVENHVIAGKIIIYPSCKDMPLTLLENLSDVKPDVASKLDANGMWTIEAEKALIEG